MRLVSRVRTALDADVSIRTLFEAPSVSELHARLCTAPKSGLADLVRQERPDRLPLSHAQQRLWFIDRLQGTSPEYNVLEPMQFNGKLNKKALEEAINTIVQRHESLRTHFAEQNGDAYQDALAEQDQQAPIS